MVVVLNHYVGVIYVIEIDSWHMAKCQHVENPVEWYAGMVLSPMCGDWVGL